MWNAGLDEAGIKIAQRNINNLRYADTTLNPKRNESWIFIGRTDAEAEAPILWPRDVKSQLIRKDSDAGKNWRQEEKWATENEMIGWHHWLKGHEFEQALGDGEGQENLACCSPWGCKELDWVTKLNWTDSLERLMLKLKLQYFGHVMWRADSFEKTLVMGKIEGRRRRGWQRMR